MTKSDRQSRVSGLIRRIGGVVVEILRSSWPAIVDGLWELVRFLIRRRLHEGLYEILDYDLTLDLRDRWGRTAIFRRRQKVRFLQDHVIAYQDEAWGDGDVVADYHCSPGVPVDIFQVGSRHQILISLRQTKNRGDVVEFRIERKVKNGFTKEKEWLEVETRYPTHRLRISILFPIRRPCQQAWVVSRRSDRAVSLDSSHFSRTSAGRQVLSWDRMRPAQGEAYTICWKW